MLFDCCIPGQVDSVPKSNLMKSVKDITFDKKVNKQFHNLVECPATITKRISMLESMEMLFSQPIFIYESEADFLLGMKYLLAIWEIILNSLNSVKLRERYLLYRFIIYICFRKEFLLESNGFDGDELCIASERIPLIKRYLYLLKITFIEACVLIEKSSNSNHLSFASKIFALACSRLPNVGEVIFTSLRDLQSHRPCPIADIRFDVFNDDGIDSDDDMNVLHSQVSYPTLELESISPSISSSIPKSFSMTYLPSDVPESMPDDWPGSESESYESSSETDSMDYSLSSENYSDDSEYSSEEESIDFVATNINDIEIQRIIHSDSSPVTMPFLFDTIIDDTDYPCVISGVSNQDILDGFNSSISPQVPSPSCNDDVPPLYVIDYTVVVDRLCYEAINNSELQEKHTVFPMDYPSLYWWCIINDSPAVCKPAEWWRERFSIHDGFFFTFVHAWFELIKDYSCYIGREVVFPCIPGYFAILRSFFPSLQSCIIHQYHCGRIRSPYIQSSYNYNMAALKASQMVLIDTSLLDIMVELLFSQCNAYFINDVLTCFLYLEHWLQHIRSSSIASTLNVKTTTPMNNNPEISILLSLERYLQIENRNASHRKLSNFDCEDNIYLKYGIKDGFLRKHALEVLIASGIVTNDFEANEAWNHLLEDDCLKQVRYDYVTGQSIWQVRKRIIKPSLYSESSSIHLPMSFDYDFFFKGLQLLLEQEHVIVLKQFLLFFYNNADLFYGPQRTTFIREHLFSDFNRLFCHWDMNIRFIFHLILLYRCVHTKRSRLPVLTANDLIAKIDSDKWKGISTMEFSKNEKDTIERLILTHEKWKSKRKITDNAMMYESKTSLAIFDSLEEENSIDLEISQQIDQYLLQVIEQINHPEQMIIKLNQRHAMIHSLAEYIRLLKDYEKMDRKNSIIEAPILDTTILVVDQGISIKD